MSAEISQSLKDLLLAEDWFIWKRDGDRVRCYVTEIWPEWLEFESLDDIESGVQGPHVAVMLQFCKSNSFHYEKHDDGSFVTPEQFLRGDL